MFNLPKCKTCDYYETNAEKQEDVTAYACYSPKYKWTDDDNAEWGHTNPLKPSLPKFIISRHCDYKQKGESNV